MDCSEVRAQLVEAAFGLAEDPAVRAHAESCATCGPALAGLAGRRRALRAWGTREPSAELNDRVLRKVRAGRRRKLFLGVAAGLLLGIPAALAGGRPAAADLIEGSFEVRQGEAWAPASGGRAAVAGLEVRTREGRARMTLGARSEIDLHPGTWIAIQSIAPSGAIVLAQKHGEAHFRVRPGSGPFEVRTPAADVRVQGTEFKILIRGEESMKKGTVLGTTLAAVVGVTSGLVTVRNSHGEIRVASGSTATATASAPPRLLAESEARLGLLEADRKEVAQRVKADAERLQELTLRARELESAVPAPKPSKKADQFKAMMNVGLRGNARTLAKKYQKLLDLSEEQASKTEVLIMKFMNDYLNAILMDAMTIDDLERLSSASETLEKSLSEILTAEQRQKAAKIPLPLDSLGIVSKIGGYEVLLKDLPAETQAAARKETDRFMAAFSVAMMRSQMLETGPESVRLLDELLPRYAERMKKIVPEATAEGFGKIMRGLTDGARKELEKQHDKK